MSRQDELIRKARKPRHRFLLPAVVGIILALAVGSFVRGFYFTSKTAGLQEELSQYRRELTTTIRMNISEYSNASDIRAQARRMDERADEMKPVMKEIDRAMFHSVCLGILAGIATFGLVFGLLYCLLNRRLLGK